uniref:Putative pseudouridine-5'-phosphate glycosidase n=1 Tax=Nyssomyia neivai TaxID=330878 RepID=A0A1L8E1E1_9DIPT
MLSKFRVCGLNGGWRIFSKVHERKYHRGLIDISPEVSRALRNSQPIVALESTIITHGMPYPQNLNTALEVEDTVRAQNAVPATIAIIKGRIKVGLSQEELVMLAAPDLKAIKTSRRDLAHIVSTGGCGGTTVAGTLIIASTVGIRLFATGGIGGVHRDGHVSMDISADLVELGRSPVAVISSGIKSILDIPRTLEYLETQGVCVATWMCPTMDFPAFYTRKSGEKATINFNSAHEAAQLIDTSLKLNLNSGILIGAPIPQEYAMDDDAIDEAISNAVEEARRDGITGKMVTPYVLGAIGKITDGRSLVANMALIKNNAKIAAQIAVELSSITNATTNVPQVNPHKYCPTIIGGSIVDICYTILNERDIEMNGATYKSETKISAGGVGRNLAEGISKLHGAARFISAVGADQNGAFIRKNLPEICNTDSMITNRAHPTANCAVVLNCAGECKIIVGDMQIHSSISPDLIERNEKAIADSSIIVIDANLTHETMEMIFKLCHKYKKPVFFEPTDMTIAPKPFELSQDLSSAVKFISPNIYELGAIGKFFGAATVPFGEISRFADEKEVLEFTTEMCTAILPHVDTIVLTLGHHGVVIASKNSPECEFFTKDQAYVPSLGHLSGRFYAATPVSSVVSVSGAGDSFASGFISAMLRRKKESVCVAVGFEATRRTLASSKTVPDVLFDANHECWSQKISAEKEFEF